MEEQKRERIPEGDGIIFPTLGEGLMDPPRETSAPLENDGNKNEAAAWCRRLVEQSLGCYGSGQVVAALTIQEVHKATMR